MARKLTAWGSNQRVNAAQGVSFRGYQNGCRRSFEWHVKVPWHQGWYHAVRANAHHTLIATADGNVETDAIRLPLQGRR